MTEPTMDKIVEAMNGEGEVDCQGAMRLLREVGRTKLIYTMKSDGKRRNIDRSRLLAHLNIPEPNEYARLMAMKAPEDKKKKPPPRPQRAERALTKALDPWPRREPEWRAPRAVGHATHELALQVAEYSDGVRAAKDAVRAAEAMLHYAQSQLAAEREKAYAFALKLPANQPGPRAPPPTRHRAPSPAVVRRERRSSRSPASSRKSSRGPSPAPPRTEERKWGDEPTEKVNGAAAAAAAAPADSESEADPVEMVQTVTEQAKSAAPAQRVAIEQPKIEPVSLYFGTPEQIAAARKTDPHLAMQPIENIAHFANDPRFKLMVPNVRSKTKATAFQEYTAPSQPQ